MSIKLYYSYLKCNNEKTGDSILASSRLNAAIHFADKKKIALKDWLNIYSIPKK